MELSRLNRLGLMLALLAAAVTGLLAMTARIDASTVLWRCAVSFAAVWVYQRLLAELWASFTCEPVASNERPARPRR